MIKIAISTDKGAYLEHATLVAGIGPHSGSPVHVRCWCPWFAPKSFEQGRLKVEFITVDEGGNSFP